MSIITRKGRTLLMAAVVAVGSVWLAGCGGDSGTNSSGGGGGDDGGTAPGTTPGGGGKKEVIESLIQTTERFTNGAVSSTSMNTIAMGMK